MDKSKKQLLDLVFCEKESTVKDKCVICGKETPYYKTTHIDFRSYYVDGCGQLCQECYNKTM